MLNNMKKKTIDRMAEIVPDGRSDIMRDRMSCHVKCWKECALKLQIEYQRGSQME